LCTDRLGVVSSGGSTLQLTDGFDARELGDGPGELLVLGVVDVSGDSHGPVANIDLNICQLSRSDDLALDLLTNEVVIQVNRRAVRLQLMSQSLQAIGLVLHLLSGGILDSAPSRPRLVVQPGPPALASLRIEEVGDQGTTDSDRCHLCKRCHLVSLKIWTWDIPGHRSGETRDHAVVVPACCGILGTSPSDAARFVWASVRPGTRARVPTKKGLRPPMIELGDPTSEAKTRNTGPSRGWLYDVGGNDSPIRIDGSKLPRIGKDQMLWIDIDLDKAGPLDQLWDQLDIPDLSESFRQEGTRPHLVRYPGFLHLNVFALRSDAAELEPIALHCLVGKNWIATLHDGALDLADRFNEPLVGETRLGELDGPRFLAMVLNWLLNGYFLAIEGQQLASDRLDEDLLGRSINDLHSEPLDRLVTMRRTVRRLRMALSQHRELLALLSQPHSDLVFESDSSSDFEHLSRRFERAIDSVDNVREMIVGSFDIFMTQTASATNEIMKRLTLVSVLLLPAAALAGIMGMNFKVAIFEIPWMFGVTLAAMAVLAGITILVAKLRRWI
jgi:magnesium transporter